MSVYEPRAELDLIAVQRDDEDLSALARRSSSAPRLDGVVDVRVLLAAFTAEVDEGLDLLLASPLAVPAPRAVPDEERVASPSERPRRRRTVRVVTASVLAAGLVSVSGVAAAVTGDPFSPYRGLWDAVYGGDDVPRGFVGTDGSTELASAVRAVESALDAGRLDRASAALERLRTGLGNREFGQQRAAAARLAALEARLARAVAKDDRTGHGRAGAPGQQAGPPAAPSAGDKPKTGNGNGSGEPGAPAAKPGTSKPDRGKAEKGKAEKGSQGRPDDKPAKPEGKPDGESEKDTRPGGRADTGGEDAAAVERPAKKTTKAGRTAKGSRGAGSDLTRR